MGIIRKFITNTGAYQNRETVSLIHDERKIHMRSVLACLRKNKDVGMSVR
jgi:propanediol utilization protein